MEIQSLQNMLSGSWLTHISRAKSENDVSPDCINITWNRFEIYLQRFRCVQQEADSLCWVKSMRLVGTLKQQVEDTVFMTVLYVRMFWEVLKFNVWNMNKRKLSKLYFYFVMLLWSIWDVSLEKCLFDIVLKCFYKK